MVVWVEVLKNMGRIMHDTMQPNEKTLFVVTVALGSRPRQGGYKVVSQEGGRESPHMLLGLQRV